MKNASHARPAWTIGLFLVIIYLFCLAWQFLLVDPAIQTLHVQLLMLTFPGFKAMTLGSMVWGGALSFVYGWVGALIYRSVVSISCKGKDSCCS